MQIQQHHQSSQCLNIQALRHQQYCNNKKLFSSFERKKMQAVKKKKKKRQQQLVYRNICKTGMKLQVLPLKRTLEYISVAEILMGTTIQ